MSIVATVGSGTVISGGEYLGGLVPATPAAKPECDILVNSLKAELRATQALVKLPLKVLNMTNKLINTVADAEIYLTDQILNNILNQLLLPLSYLNDPNLSLQNSANVLNAMLNCAYVIGNKDLLSALLTAKGMFDQGRYLWANMPRILKRLIGKLIGDEAHAIINSLRNTALGKINNIASSYNNLLRTSGILKGLQKMDQILNCASGLCTALDAEIAQINGIYSTLGINDDYTVNSIFTTSSAISSNKKYIVGKTSDKFSTVTTMIDQFYAF